MPVLYYGTQVLATTGIALNVSAANSMIYVLRTGALLSTGDRGIYSAFSATQITVEGTVAGASYGIETAGAIGSKITVTATGSVYGATNAIFVTGADASVTNAGTITTGGSWAVNLSSGGGRVINTGQISATTAGDGAGAVRIGDADGYLSNSGTIWSAGNRSTGEDPAVWMDNGFGTSSWVVNSGEITGFAIGIRGGQGSNYIQNTGHIEGSIDLGGGSGTDRLINHGDIFGDVFGLGVNNSVIDNRGMIDTVVTGSTGSDLVRNSGSIYRVVFGDGADVLRMSGEGTVLEYVSGGNGNDLLIGAGVADDLRGEDGLDTLRGQAGDDTLSGGALNDQLLGGDGDDILLGGTGVDRLRGGAGLDSFVFKTSSETVTGLKNDVILDFQRGLDVMDLTDVTTQVLSFVGTTPLPGGGQRTVGYALDGQGNATVSIDVNGDGTADGRITLMSVTTLTAADFLL